MTRHHLVPQMYLRLFADERSRITLVDRDDLDRAFRTSVKKACAEVGFYDWRPDLHPDSPPVDEEILHPEFVERSLSAFESRAVSPIRRILSSGQPPHTKEDRYHLTNFIAFQMTRTRRFREDLSATGTKAMREHLKSTLDAASVAEWLRARGEPYSPEDVREFIASATGEDGPRLVPDPAYAIQQAVGQALTTVAEALWTRQWAVAAFDEPRLLTSDEPVVLWHPGDEPVGPVNAPIVWLALGRRHLLEMRADDAPLLAQEDRAAIFNAAVATGADRWIIHHPHDTRLLAETVVGPRSAWGDEVVRTTLTEDEVRVLKRHRRLPVNPDTPTT
ncbi:DUF4238 domain-containing protein [Nocardioides euryhalodurans]|uniref:DUF4238 domain-containing protein n=1 Tax=Nocardioides euryhalodurans TaxID=2518370 RepID=A0A4P7GPN0_9ACTN|nr:DUF4238 domain-containing protein [Nocardioides euryhalodurans]QBR93757.1 DUF4238 domain-containing protein [Nocardioides euryhalodurans]